jgi:hypothetical protein
LNSKTNTPAPEIIDMVLAKTSPKRSFSMTEYERFGLVFTKTRVYKFGHWTVEIRSIAIAPAEENIHVKI